MKLKQHIIYDDYNTSIDDYADYFEQLEEENGEELSESEKWDIYYDEIRNWLDCERVNLNKRLNTDIIAIADIGRWDGRVQGYKIIGRNLSDILWSDCDYCIWSCDRYNVRGKMIHHDGVNYVVYRAFKDGLSDEQRERFLDALYYGKCTPNMISRYTRSIVSEVNEVYGWYPKKKKAEQPLPMAA